MIQQDFRKWNQKGTVGDPDMETDVRLRRRRVQLRLVQVSRLLYVSSKVTSRL